MTDPGAANRHVWQFTLMLPVALMLSACSSAQPPMAIKMYHPETKQALDRLIIDVESALGEPHLTHVSSPGVCIQVWRQRINGDLSRYLIAL